MSRPLTTPPAIVAWGRHFLADLLELRLTDIDPQARFTEFGLDSGKSVQFVLALEDWLGIELNPEIIEEHPTLEVLADYLARCNSSQAGMDPRGRTA